MPFINTISLPNQSSSVIFKQLMKTIIFSILITTKNRRGGDLCFEALRNQHLLKREDVECFIYDDVITFDDTFDFVKNNYPQIKLQRKQKNSVFIL
jgi:hypothetical protein